MRHGTPQVLITLAPSGALQMELPGTTGIRRVIAIKQSDGAEWNLRDTLRRVLQGQLTQRWELGADGSPTEAQVWHWERHGIWRDPGCKFCVAEMREEGIVPKLKRERPVVLLKRDGVEVRKVRSGKKGLRKQRATGVDPVALGI